VAAKPTHPDRRLRADAARNRAAILAAAESVFAERGRAMSTEEVAMRAGVGIGTLFRHFPTKQALLEALLLAHVEQLAAEADALAVDDGGEALLLFFEHVVEQAARKRPLVEALAETGVNVKQLMRGAAEDFRAAVGQLLERAQQRGVVREDVKASDIVALLMALSKGADQAGWDKGTRRRTLAVVIDGLRARRP
jgi:AcrR family transcriptional regulator